MKYTQNLNMKIPEGGDPIDIADITENFETLDIEINKKANTSGGDISDTTIKTVDAIATEFPVPSAGESSKTFLGKVRKFIQDFIAIKDTLLTLSKLVNNGQTTTSGFALDARYGKTLADQITKLNTDLSVVGSSTSTIKNLNTAVEYLSGFSSTDVETDCLKPVESGIYIKKTGLYLVCIRFAFSGCENNQLTYGHRNFISADNYVDSYDIDYCSHIQSFNRTQVRVARIEAGRYIRPLVGGSVSAGRCTAANISILSIKSD